MPEGWRTRFVNSHLPAEGAWWLRPRVDNLIPTDLNTSVVEASATNGRVALRLRNSADGSESALQVDHVIAGNGYDINVDRLSFMDPKLRGSIERIERSPRLNARFESTVPGLHFVGPMSAMSFGPLFRFVVGAGYTARTVSTHLAAQVARAEFSMEVSSAA
jgi:hypothetical protein